ncbi:hypothetical protein [Persicitalea sp.]|uniref:hypothetical protein n=1 Tax=Persicitalea sp. TaxID=3100273 RepID=UPI0035938670
MTAPFVLDSYSLNPELSQLRDSGTSIIWNFEAEKAKRIFANSTVVKDRVRPFSSNYSKIADIAKFRELTDDWDEEGAIAPPENTIASAEALANNLDLTGQKIYHSSPGPNGEILISLRNGQKSLELLVFPSKDPKIVSLSDRETPTQKVLNPENLKASLSWLYA